MQLDTCQTPAAAQTDPSIRRHPRAPFSVPITLHHLMVGGVGTSHGISVDLSETGLGAVVQGKVRVGDAVGIDFPLEGYVLNLVAIVRHASNVHFGFEFLGLTPEERVQITNAADQHSGLSRTFL